MVSRQLLDQLSELNRVDKLHVIQVLVSQLAQEETDLLEPNTEYPIWSPYDAYDAAATMLNMLKIAESDDNA
ncbi:MAG: hypothetical protein U0641_10050 [Anaerolineae bacterium]